MISQRGLAALLSAASTAFTALRILFADVPGALMDDQSHALNLDLVAVFWWWLGQALGKALEFTT